MVSVYMPYGAVTCATSAYGKTATTLTVGHFGMEIDQYVVMYTVHTVETSGLKGPPYLHRRVMKPSTTVSSCVKAKVSKCWVTSDRGFEICILKSHG